MTAEGYPASYRKGDEIAGLEGADGPDVKVFHAGTAHEGERVITAGGRVLCVTALGGDVASAQQAAYAVADRSSWPGVHYRRDIGHRAVTR